MVDDLRELVVCESPSADLSALARSAEVVAAQGRRRLDAEPERIDLGGRVHLRWRFGSGDRVLLLGHHDTVWPVGSLTEHPWRIEDGRAYGPGCFDMLAGLVQMFHALASLPSRDGVTVLVTADEEVGAPTSHDLIEQEARRVDAALVFEGSADGGALKTSRNGICQYEVRVYGRAAHAGLEPWNGVNAAVELAHQVLAIANIGKPDAAPGSATVVPTVLQAGTTTNTVPAAASIQVDARVPSLAERDRVDSAIRSLSPRLPEATIEVVDGPRRPPLESTMSAELYAVAEQVASGLGLDRLSRAHVGGGSDGNIAAGVGTPTLDGLGAVGGNAHAPGEHVHIDEMPRRAALAAGVLERLLAGSWPSTNDRPQDREMRP